MQNSQINNVFLKNLSDLIGAQGANRVVRSFVDELPKAEAAIAKSLLEKDLNEIHKIGHKNKSSSKTVGALHLADLFTKLENCENLDTADEISREINVNSLQVSSEMNDFISH